MDQAAYEQQEPIVLELTVPEAGISQMKALADLVSGEILSGSYIAVFLL